MMTPCPWCASTYEGEYLTHLSTCRNVYGVPWQRPGQTVLEANAITEDCISLVRDALRWTSWEKGPITNHHFLELRKALLGAGFSVAPSPRARTTQAAPWPEVTCSFCKNKGRFGTCPECNHPVPTTEQRTTNAAPAAFAGGGSITFGNESALARAARRVYEAIEANVSEDIEQTVPLSAITIELVQLDAALKRGARSDYARPPINEEAQALVDRLVRENTPKATSKRKLETAEVTALRAAVEQANRYVVASEAHAARDWDAFKVHNLAAVSIEYARMRDALIALALDDPRACSETPLPSVRASDEGRVRDWLKSTGVERETPGSVRQMAALWAHVRDASIQACATEIERAGRASPNNSDASYAIRGAEILRAMVTGGEDKP